MKIFVGLAQMYWIIMKVYKCNTVLLLRISLLMYSVKTV